MQLSHPLIASIQRKLKPFVQSLQPLQNNRWLRVTVYGVILIFAAGFLVNNFQDLQNELVSAEFRWSSLLLGQFFTFLSAVLGPLAWWLLLRGLGQHTAFMQSTRAYTLSQLTKYIPGFAWQYVSKAYMTREAGASHQSIAIALLLEFIQTICIGISIALVSVPVSLLTANGFSIDMAILIRIIGIVSCLLILATPYILSLFLQKRGSNSSFSAQWLSAEQVLIAAGWFLLGCSLYAFAGAFSQQAPSDLSIYVSTMASGVVGGILFLLVPQGIGIREGIIGIMLTNYLPSTTTFLITLTSRLCMTLSELFLVGLVELWRWHRRQGPEHGVGPTQV